MKHLTNIYRRLRCYYCGKSVDSSGSGTNMGSNIKPMCERCYEKGGDDE